MALCGLPGCASLTSPGTATEGAGYAAPLGYL